ncbi:hypothetical protein VNI00_009310 [Paramarasmius palmivorus]|uniref:NADP-dependent oxidoreductase domain-containing protein n=1 Tax=Paramarasmius palmivorus TaxID=297713 RepID=A0AAW0CSI6_9AGAR
MTNGLLATWYRPNGGQGACGAPVANSDVSVALAPEHYKDGELCWKRIGIWSDGNYIDATVADCCPTCGPDDIDLTESAFQHLASLDTGRMKAVAISSLLDIFTQSGVFVCYYNTYDQQLVNHAPQRLIETIKCARNNSRYMVPLRRELGKLLGMAQLDSEARKRTGPCSPQFVPSHCLTMSVPKIKLNNGAEIPAVGLGTWQSKPEEVVAAVSHALKEGYRHIDCAWGYGNEKDVGEGIRQSGVPRSEIFITSKLWGTYHSRVEECLDETLSNLGTDYLDLYLVHWPVPLNPKGNHPVFPTLPDGKRDVDHSWKLADTWKQMEAVLKKGKVKSIGVSNFSVKKLEEILPTAEVVPVVNQLEIHAYNPQHELLAYLRSKSIVPQAYSPLGSSNSPLLKDDVITSIAEKHSLQPADVLLGWLVAKDIVALPKSVTPARITANLKGAIAASTKLTKEDIETIDGLAASGKQKRFIMPPWPVDLGFDNWPNKVV